MFTAAGKNGNNCPILRTTTSGLKPGSVREVYGFYAVFTFVCPWGVILGLFSNVLDTAGLDEQGVKRTIVMKSKAINPPAFANM